MRPPVLDEGSFDKEFAFAQRSQVLLEARKSLLQGRSAASADAIPDLTIQVLPTVGRNR